VQLMELLPLTLAEVADQEVVAVVQAALEAVDLVDMQGQEYQLQELQTRVEVEEEIGIL